MPRAPKPCNHLGCLELATPGSGKCDDHLRHKRRTATPSPTSIDRTNTPGERQRRQAIVNAWRNTHGDWCPGWQRPAHHATDLTAAHVTAVANGGHDINGVLCRSCNSRQGQTPLTSDAEGHGGTP